MKKKLLFEALLGILCLFNWGNAYSQNPAWSLAPHSLKTQYGVPSPLPTSSGGYDTTITPKAASNMQLDAQGNILFLSLTTLSMIETAN